MSSTAKIIQRGLFGTMTLGCGFFYYRLNQINEELGT